MAYSKKKRGFRAITVNGVTYRWRLKLGYPDSALIVQDNLSSGQQPVIDLHNWHDPIYDISGFSEDNGKLRLYTSQQNDPASITPRFVRQAIFYGLEHGWTPDKRANALVIEWDNALFDGNLPHPPAPSPPGGEGEMRGDQVPSPLDGEGI